MKESSTKLTIFVTTVSVLALNGSLLANTVVSPVVSEVRVYPHGADVIRQFVVDVPAGDHRVVIQGLPASVGDFAVRAIGSSSHVRIIDTKRATKFDDEAFAAKVRELDKQIDELNQTIAQHEDELLSIEMEVALLQGVVEQHPQQKVPESEDVEAGLQRTRGVLALIRESSKEAFDSRREVQRALNDAKTRLRQLRSERNQIGGRELESAELSLGLVSTEDKKTAFVVSYYSSQAGWHSTYHAYLDSGSKSLTIVHDAVVLQNSPENWQDVALVLSTTNPDRRTAPPRQFSHFVDLREKDDEVVYDQAYAVTGARVAEPSAPSVMLEERVYAGMHFVPVSALPFSTEYRTPNPQSVANDSSEHGIKGLGSYAIDNVEIKTTIVPRHDDVGYLAANFEYDQDIPLPEGEMRCFVDDSFVGEILVGNILPNEDVVIPLGIDQRIRVVVENQGGMKGDEGIFRNRKVEETHFLVLIENNGSSGSSLEVLDYYPVARHEDIRVEVHRDATAPSKTDIDDRPGRIAWTKDLDSGGTWKILQRYSVSYPRDTLLSRSNR